MRILAINCSPRKNGNTSRMLKTVLAAAEASAYDTELYQAGGKPVSGCKACGGCSTNKGFCATDDWVNELYPKMKSADAIIIGSPTYFADCTPEAKAVMDRAGYISRKDGFSFCRKIGAAVCPARRAGSIHAIDSINHFFLINDMIVPGSTYWNMSLSASAEDYEKDEEGILTMQRLGENIVWLLQNLVKS